MIYLIKNNNFLKIGYTKDTEERLKAYDTHNPDYEVIATREGDRKFETFLHNRFKQYQIKTEWYEYNEDIIQDFLYFKNEEFNFPNGISEQNVKTFFCFEKVSRKMNSIKASNILLYLFWKVKYNYNRIILTQEMREELSKLTEYSSNTITNGLKILKDNNVIKKENNEFILNVLYMFKGDLKTRDYILSKNEF